MYIPCMANPAGNHWGKYRYSGDLYLLWGLMLSSCPAKLLTEEVRSSPQAPLGNALHFVSECKLNKMESLTSPPYLFQSEIASHLFRKCKALSGQAPVFNMQQGSRSVYGPHRQVGTSGKMV